MHEASLHDCNSFVTLTYETPPPNNSLNVEDWQRFAKRLRKKVGRLRFYQAGEYGEATNRPHHHACLFGHNFSSDRTLYRHSNGNSLYTSKLLEDTWGHGFAVIGELTFESAAYVARYVTKKVTGDQALDEYYDYDPATGEVISERKPPFATMSRRPGIGADYYDKWRGEMYPRDEIIARGKAQRPPKFYDAREEARDKASFLKVKRKRIQAALRHADDLTPERLAVREQVRIAEHKLYSRDPGGK